MTVTEELPISIVDSLDKRKYPTPEEYNYWKSRENRTFFIDYEVDEFYNLIELSKVIIQMNMEEREVEVQEFNGIDYFIYDTVLKNDNKYVIFVSIEDENDILIAKEIDDEYEIVEEEEREEILYSYKGKDE